MSYRSYLSSSQYVHKVCGMNPNLIKVIQEIRRLPDEGSQLEKYESIVDRFRTHLLNNKIVSDGDQVEVRVGSAGRDYYCSTKSDGAAVTLVVIYLLMDEISIDCKMITFTASTVSGFDSSEKGRVWSVLYKYDPTTAVN